MDASHQHPPEAACPPTCPAWSDGALQLFAVQRRYADMLEACRAAEVVESVVVAPNVAGVSLPEYLAEEDVVRLNLVVGRDTPELLMDEWGLHCNLTFRQRRNDCAIPWAAILAGKLRPPARRRPAFAVLEGRREQPPPESARGDSRSHLAVIEGGKKK